MKTNLIRITDTQSKLVFDVPGRYVVYFSNLSGTISCRIESENVELYLIGLYDLHVKQKHTIHTEQIHTAANSHSDTFIAAVMDGESSLTFSGLIRIEKNAHGSHAYQKNANLMVSPNAFVDSRPILEILANDVFCTHGSSSGPVSPDQLSYLQTKGLTESQAKQLIIDGFKQQVVEKALQWGVTL